MRNLIRNACQLVRIREIELVIAPPPPPFTFCLHAEYDCYGDFFSIVASNVLHVEFTSGLVVGEMLFAPDVRQLLGRFNRWEGLAEEFYSNALVVVAAPDTPVQRGAMAAGIIVAENIVIVPGVDWMEHSAEPG